MPGDDTAPLIPVSSDPSPLEEIWVQDNLVQVPCLSWQMTEEDIGIEQTMPDDIDSRNAMHRVSAQVQPRRGLPSSLIPEFMHVTTVPAHRPLRSNQRLLRLDGDVQVVGVYREPSAFLEEALDIMHPFDGDEVVPRPMAVSIWWVLSRPPDMVTKERLGALSELVRWREGFLPEERRRAEKREQVVASILRGKQVALLRHVFVRSGYSDVKVVDELEKGFSLVNSSLSRAFPAKKREASSNMNQLMRKAAERRANLASLCSTSGDHDLDKRLWDATLTEVEHGWLEGPLEADELDRRFPGGWLPMRRFGIIQGNKVRPIDDCRESGLNEVYEVKNGLDLHDVDVIASAARLAMRVGAGSVTSYAPCGEQPLEFSIHNGWVDELKRGWVGRRLDLKAAYKQIPLDPSSRALAVVCVFRPGSPDRPGLFQTNVLPFGATSSVFAFNRLARGLWHAAAYFLHLVMGNYYDDYPSIEPKATAEAALAIQNFFFRLLGWEVAGGDKCLEHSEEFEVLGVIFKLAMGESIPKIVICNKPGRCREVADELLQISTSRLASRRRCAQVAGKLQFMRGQIQGYVVQPAVAVLNSLVCSRSSTPRLSADARRTLQELATYIVRAPPRTLTTVEVVKPILVFTDGACEADGDTYGIVVIDTLSGRRLVASGRVPADLAEAWRSEVGDQIISQVEIFPIVVYRWWAGQAIAGRRLIFYIDNESARMALIRAHSSSRVSRMLIAAFFKAEEGCACYPWFARVPSHSNVADRPSRGEAVESARDIGAVLVTMTPPAELIELVRPCVIKGGNCAD